jgi:hypothetical protein
MGAGRDRRSNLDSIYKNIEAGSEHVHPLKYAASNQKLIVRGFRIF